MYSSVYCTAVFIVQKCLLYSSIYCAAVFILQQYLLYNSNCCTAAFIVQQYLLYGSVYCTAVYIFNSVYCTAVFIVQRCLFTKMSLNILFKRDRPAACGYQFGDPEILHRIPTVKTAAHCFCAACCVTLWRKVRLEMSLL